MLSMPLFVPKRKKSGHKGDNGRVLLIGGSEKYSGALALAGLAALRSGCDLVIIAAPEKVAWAINCLSPDLITVKLSGQHLSFKHYKTILEESKKADVLLIGNGAGLHPETKRLIFKLADLPQKKVFDADALKIVNLKKISNAVFTPHSGEFEAMLKTSKLKSIKDVQQCLGSNIILLKGPVDKIITKNKVVKIKGGNPGMTKGGTGDVLAGLLAGYIAQGLSLFQAAANASIINKKIGDILLKKKKGYTYLASDMVEEIKKIR